MYFIERHEPQIWSDLIFADNANEVELRLYAERKSFGHILLYGPYGTGKTHTAKVLAAASYGLDVRSARLDIVDLHTIQERIPKWKDGIGFGLSRMINCPDHVYQICNEVDQFSQRDQYKLRALMDEMSLARFIFTTNHISAVDRGIVDRCDIYELDTPPAENWLNRAKAICQAEGVSISEETCLELLKEVDGSMRNVLRVLEKYVLNIRASA